MAAQGAVNSEVVGSNPTLPARFFQGSCESESLLCYNGYINKKEIKRKDLL